MIVKNNRVFKTDSSDPSFLTGENKYITVTFKVGLNHHTTPHRPTKQL